MSAQRKTGEKKTYETITPGYRCPIESSRINPIFINRFPEHRFGSQWPRSQQAALNGGLEEVDEFSLSPRGRGRGVKDFFAPREKLSFLWRTMIDSGYIERQREKESVCVCVWVLSCCW